MTKKRGSKRRGSKRRGSKRLSRNAVGEIGLARPLYWSDKPELVREVGPKHVGGRSFDQIPHIDTTGRATHAERHDLNRSDLFDLAEAVGETPLFIALREEELLQLPVATVKVVRLAEDWRRPVSGGYHIDRAGSIRTTRTAFKVHAPGCRFAVTGPEKHLPRREDPWNRTQLMAEVERTELWPSLAPPNCAKCAGLPFSIPGASTG